MKIMFKVRLKYGREVKTLREIRGLEERMEGKSRGKLDIKEYMLRSGFWTWSFIYFTSYNSHNKVFILYKMKLRLREVKYFAKMKTEKHTDPQPIILVSGFSNTDIWTNISIISHQRCKLNHNEIPPHTHQNNCH